MPAESDTIWHSVAQGPAIQGALAAVDGDPRGPS